MFKDLKDSFLFKNIEISSSWYETIEVNDMIHLQYDKTHLCVKVHWVWTYQSPHQKCEMRIF